MSDKTKIVLILVTVGGCLMIGGGLLWDIYHYRATSLLMICIGAAGFLRAIVEDQT